MKPGAILYDRDFVYSDGERGEKLLVLLNDGEIGYYIVVKTTSNGIHKGRKLGCQLTDNYPNFFLPEGSCWFCKDTWIGLDRFFESDVHKLLDKRFSRQIIELRGNLSPKITCSLLECAIKSEDISLRNRYILKETLSSL